MEKKLAGAPLIPIRERNYKEKPCKVCGEWFKPVFPYQKYCSEDCKQAGYKQVKKANDKRANKRSHDRIVAYNTEHHFCPLCGKPLTSKRQHVHFDCMLKRWAEGDRSQRIKWYFYNKGYNQADINEMCEQMG